MEELTKKQRAILDYMKAHVAEHSYWPSIRDIQAKFRFASTNGVYGHLQALERKGVLQRIPGAAPGTVRHRGGEVIWGVPERALSLLATRQP